MKDDQRGDKLQIPDPNRLLQDLEEKFIGLNPLVDPSAENWNEEEFIISYPRPGKLSKVIHRGRIHNYYNSGRKGVLPQINEYAVAKDKDYGRTLLVVRSVDLNGNVIVDWGPIGEYDGENLGILAAYRGEGAGVAFVRYLIEHGMLRRSIGFSPGGLATVQKAIREYIASLEVR